MTSATRHSDTSWPRHHSSPCGSVRRQTRAPPDSFSLLSATGVFWAFRYGDCTYRSVLYVASRAPKVLRPAGRGKREVSYVLKRLPLLPSPWPLFPSLLCAQTPGLDGLALPQEGVEGAESRKSGGGPRGIFRSLDLSFRVFTQPARCQVD